MIGIRIAVIATILISFILANSCTKDIELYHLTIKNEYFETLYNTKIGDIQFDTISVNATTPDTIINQGDYIFSTETESGLVLKTDIKIQGDNQKIRLILDEHGKLSSE